MKTISLPIGAGLVLLALAFAPLSSAGTFTGRAGEKCDPNDPNESTGSPSDYYHPKNWGTPCDPQSPPWVLALLLPFLRDSPSTPAG